MHKEIVKILGNVVAFTFLACVKAFEFLGRGRLGAHSTGRARLRSWLRLIQPPAPVAEAATDRVVQAHHVLSGRLMDAPTGRLYPSSRHRVPPWVAPPGP